MKNLVVGAGYNLTWEQCRVWVNSLNDSGFTGDKILVYFGNNIPLFSKLSDHGVMVAAFASLTAAHNVCVTRFGAYHALLKNSRIKYDWVLATDVTDVAFQKNPDEWLNSDIVSDADHIASSENLRYHQEPWNKNNIILSFGEDQYKLLEKHTIYNAGVIAAKHDRMADVSNMIYQMSIARLQHVFGGGGPDQSAYNIFLSTDTLNRNTDYYTHDTAWACQCAATMDPAKPDLVKANMEPPPTFNGEHVVNSRGVPYTIVHQYNRVPEIKEYYERKYNGN